MGNKASCCLNLRSKIHAEEMDVNSVGKAKTCQFFSISRPYMRVFHSSWFCLFIANTSLFSLQPMLPVLHRDLNLTEVQLANSGFALVASSICVRLEAGPLCDIFGSRKVMSLLLIFGSIAPALVGLVEDGTGLIIIRFFIGFLGGTFVPSQLWNTSMFRKDIIGPINAVTGGLGNMGMGFVLLIMPELFELIKLCGANQY